MDNELIELMASYKDVMVPVTLGVPEIYVIVSNLQLALTHPDNNGPSSLLAVALCKRFIEEVIAFDQRLKPLFDAGWIRRNMN